MSYLDKYDTMVKVRCCNLTPSQKIKTGFRTMGDVKRAVALVHNPLNQKHFGRVVFSRTEEQQIQDILVNEKIITPSGIRYSVLDSGDDQAIRPAPENNFGDASSDWSGSERSFDSPPMSAVAEEEMIGQNIQQQIALYERGIIDARQLEDNVRQLRGDIRDVMEVAVAPDAEGNLIPYAEREEIVDRAQAYSSAIPAPAAPEVGRVSDEGSYVPPEFVPEYTPTVRRRGVVEVNPNRGSGSAQVNPNAPSYSAGGSGRGTSRQPGRNDFDREFDTPQP